MLQLALGSTRSMAGEVLAGRWRRWEAQVPTLCGQGWQRQQEQDLGTQRSLSISSGAIVAVLYNPWGWQHPLPPGAVAVKLHLGGGEPKEEGGGKLVYKGCPCYALTCLRTFYKTYLQLKPRNFLFQERPQIWSCNCGVIFFFLLKNTVLQKMTPKNSSSLVSLCFWERQWPFCGKQMHSFHSGPYTHISIGCKTCLASKCGEFSQKVKQNWTSCLLNCQALEKVIYPDLKICPVYPFFNLGLY